jgi:hypothetical protein
MPARPSDPATPNDEEVPAPDAETRAQELDPEDFYLEGQYMVFTAAYHLKRGSCCHSGCRHCPYRDSDESGEA